MQLAPGPNATLVIAAVMPKTSAATCGIKVGDVLTHIDDARVGHGMSTRRFVGTAWRVETLFSETLLTPVTVVSKDFI